MVPSPGSKSDHAPVKKEHEGKQDRVQDHIKGAVGNRSKPPQSMGKNLKWVHAKCRKTKYSCRDTGQKNSYNTHDQPLLKFVHFGSPFLYFTAALPHQFSVHNLLLFM